jgi:hypothetical protein
MILSGRTSALFGRRKCLCTLDRGCFSGGNEVDDRPLFHPPAWHTGMRRRHDRFPVVPALACLPTTMACVVPFRLSHIISRQNSSDRLSLTYWISDRSIVPYTKLCLKPLSLNPPREEIRSRHVFAQSVGFCVLVGGKRRGYELIADSCNMWI